MVRVDTVSAMSAQHRCQAAVFDTSAQCRDSVMQNKQVPKLTDTGERVVGDAPSQATYHCSLRHSLKRDQINDLESQNLSNLSDGVI